MRYLKAGGLAAVPVLLVGMLWATAKPPKTHVVSKRVKKEVAAKKTWQETLVQHSKTSLVKAELLCGQKRFREARVAFAHVFVLCETNPEETAQALYGAYLCSKELGDWETKAVCRNELMRVFPQSPWTAMLKQE